jgi:hypothetical protein
MTTFYRIPNFASTYGSGSYDVGNYNGTNVTTTGSGTGTSGTGSGSALSNTGVLVGMIVGVAAATLLIAMVVRIWRRPKRAPVTVSSDGEASQ